MPEEETLAKPITKHKVTKKRLLMVALVLLILAGAGALAWYQLVYKGPIPYKYRKQVHTTLYYSQNLPANLYVDRSSFNVPSPNVLTYIVRDTKGNKFYVSQQPAVNNFDFTAFKKKFEHADSLDTPNGSALLGDLGNQLLCSLLTPKNTWIIINTLAYTQNGELSTTCRTLSQL